VTAREFKRTPYWVFFLVGPITVFLTMLAVRRSLAGDFWSIWLAAAFPSAIVFAIVEAVRRRREED
jgi:hypothetical protein